MNSVDKQDSAAGQNPAFSDGIGATDVTVDIFNVYSIFMQFVV